MQFKLDHDRGVIKTKASNRSRLDLNQCIENRVDILYQILLTFN